MADETDRGQGEGALPPSFADDHHSRADSRLIARAIRARWEVDPKYAQPLLNRQVRIALGEDDRNAIAAFRAILESQKVELAIQEHENPTTQKHEHTHQVAVAVVRQELLNDPDYLEFQRQRAIEQDVQSSAVCAGVISGQVENGQAPGVS